MHRGLSLGAPGHPGRQRKNTSQSAIQSEACRDVHKRQAQADDVDQRNEGIEPANSLHTAFRGLRVQQFLRRGISPH